MLYGAPVEVPETLHFASGSDQSDRRENFEDVRQPYLTVGITAQPLRGCFGFLLKFLPSIRRRLSDAKTIEIAPLCLTFLHPRSTRRLNYLYSKQIQTASERSGLATCYSRLTVCSTSTASRTPLMGARSFRKRMVTLVASVNVSSNVFATRLTNASSRRHFV